MPVKEKKAEKIGAIAEAFKCFNRLIQNDPSIDLLQFLREDNEKDRKHEMEMLKLQVQLQIDMQLQMMKYFAGFSQGMQGQFLHSNMPSTSFQRNSSQGISDFLICLIPQIKEHF